MDRLSLLALVVLLSAASGFLSGSLRVSSSFVSRCRLGDARRASSVLTEEKEAVEEGVVVDDWEGHQEGFDWQLERARRALEGPGFSPLRMSFWRPPDEGDMGELPQPSMLDHMIILASNALQIFLGMDSVDGAPLANIKPYKGNLLTLLRKVLNGKLEDLAGGPLFLLLQKYAADHGGVFKLAFGPKSFIVVSDPVMAKHILRIAPQKYDKGILAEILEPIMGKGLIPADLGTWKHRRRAIVPGFHSRWLNRMVRLFAECADALKTELRGKDGQVVDMETYFCSVSLDIIGKAVFNYEFGSVTQESPVIKAVYKVLREAEHRSSSFIPYWKLPYAEYWISDQIEFRENMEILNDVLDELILQAIASQEEISVEELQTRDYETTDDPSLLRFLVDMRGEDTSCRQLRDDLMTMLIAGHETTAAVLTWSLHELVSNPSILKEVRREIDQIYESKAAGETLCYDDLSKLELTRLSLIEALRMYPEPPVLIRRTLVEDHLPSGGTGYNVRLVKGSDVFISTWTLHRSELYWKDGDRFDPYRWKRDYGNEAITGWNGYNASLSSGLYPNEVTSDFAFLPFGGGTRKCVGDQFAMMESTILLAEILREFDFEREDSEVGMVTGATIHTDKGLNLRVGRRRG